MFNIAVRLMTGDGVNYNLHNGIAWMMQAAKSGVAEALYKLGRCYIAGYGVEKDTVKAILCWNEAEDAGHARAHDCLQILRDGGTMFFGGPHRSFPLSALTRPAPRIFDVGDISKDILP
jgi:TPR repeat protein